MTENQKFLAALRLTVQDFVKKYNDGKPQHEQVIFHSPAATTLKTTSGNEVERVSMTLMIQAPVKH